MSEPINEHINQLIELLIDCNTIPASFFQKYFNNDINLKCARDVCIDISFDKEENDYPNNGEVLVINFQRLIDPSIKEQVTYQFVRLSNTTNPDLPPTNACVFLNKKPELKEVIRYHDKNNFKVKPELTSYADIEKVYNVFLKILDNFKKSAVY